MIDFEEEFASIFDYARMYRSLGLQVVPSVYPSKGVLNWKRPALNGWREHQNEIASDAQFEGFFLGINQNKTNIGILTGACSGGVFVVDLDTHKVPDASLWWDCCLDMQASAGELETPTQKTGGGGIQMLFRAPDGWSPPTIKTSAGVDIRGVGGFAVIAPSMHESGKRYRWEEGLEPWSVPIAVAPAWFCEQIDLLAERFGGHAAVSGAGVKTHSPDHQVSQWGKIVDGREDLMTRIVFRAVLQLYRDCPIIPPQAEISAEMEVAFNAYLDLVDSRIDAPNADKAALLEREGRGRTLFAQKWRAAFRQWDGKISEEAKRPFVKEKPATVDPFAEPPPKPGSVREEKEQSAEDTSQDSEKSAEDDFDLEPKKKKLLKLYTIDEIESFGPVQALIQDTVAEGSLGFIYGPPGCGKTFVALSMALSISYGFDQWFWGKKIERHGPVVYISLEGKADLGNRLKAWKAHHNIQHNDQRFRAIIDQVNFTREESVKLFVDSLDEYMATYEPPAMIFIDTVSRAIAGGGENDADEISLFIETCGNLQRRYSTNLTGIHHTGRLGTNMRGSSAFDGGADFMYRVERDKKSGLTGLIHAEKIKAYPDAWEMPFRLEKIDLDAFGAQSSLVAIGEAESPSVASSVDFGGDQETGYLTIGKKLPDHVWKAIFDEAEAEWNEGTPWSESKNAKSRYAGERIWNIVHTHLGNFTFSESDADYVLKKLTGAVYLKSVDYIHNKMVKTGLKVVNRPRV